MKKRIIGVVLASLLIGCVGCSSKDTSEPVTQDIAQAEVATEVSQAEEIVQEETVAAVETESEVEEVVESAQVVETQTEQETEEASSEEVVETWYRKNADKIIPLGETTAFKFHQYNKDENGACSGYSLFDAPVKTSSITEKINGDGTKKVTFKVTFDTTKWLDNFCEVSFTVFDIETGTTFAYEKDLKKLGLDLADYPVYFSFDELYSYDNYTALDLELVLTCPEDYQNYCFAVYPSREEYIGIDHEPKLEDVNGAIEDEVKYAVEKGYKILYYTTYQP